MITFPKIFLLIIITFGYLAFEVKTSFKSVAETIPKELNKILLLEQWRYSKFIQEVEKGNIEKVSFYRDGTTAIVTSKNDAKQKRVNLVNDPELIKILINKDVDINVVPGLLQPMYENLSTWSYSQLLREVENGNVKQAMLTSDGYTAFVFYKNDPNLKLVHLINNPELINYLVNKVDITVVPVNKNTDIVSISYTENLTQGDTREETPENQPWSYSKLIQEIDKNNVASVTINQDVSELSAISKNGLNSQLVYLVKNPKLIETLIKNKVDITVLPETIHVQDKKFVQLKLSHLIQEASNGNIKQLNVYQDRPVALVTFKNDVKKKLVYLPQYPSLISTLVRDGVDITAISKKTDEKDRRLEQWSYTKFIREVKRGAVERVSLSADRSKVMVKSKKDAERKLVYLVDDPELINTLTTNNVDISVLP